MRAVIYARYSSDKQSITSIEDQERLCRQYAVRHGLTVAEVFSDAEISGAVSDRPGYQRMLAAAKRREFDWVLAEHQDRLTRDDGGVPSLLKTLRHWQVKLYPVATGDLDLTDPRTGRTLTMVGGLQSAMFIEDLREKTHRG